MNKNFLKKPVHRLIPSNSIIMNSLKRSQLRPGKTIELEIPTTRFDTNKKRNSGKGLANPNKLLRFNTLRITSSLLDEFANERDSLRDNSIGRNHASFRIIDESVAKDRNSRKNNKKKPTFRRTSKSNLYFSNPPSTIIMLYSGVVIYFLLLRK